MAPIAPNARLNQFFRIARLLAGQLDFLSAIRAVSAEIAELVPHDHLDVCIVGQDGKFHTAYETGIDTDWGRLPHELVVNSPIRALLMGEVDYLLTADACTDPRFQGDSRSHRPIFVHALRSRLHLPMIVHGEIIGALSCSLKQAGRYGPDDVRNARHITEMLSPYFFALRAAEQARLSAIVETEARAREEGLRQGALKLTEALERERQRIGMDLHDQTLADLTRLTRLLERLAMQPALSPADLGPVTRSLHQSMQALRQIIEEAKPSVLHLFGFAQAVENHMDRAIRDSGQLVQGQLVDETDGAIDALPLPVGFALFRIAQEAVNNAVIHAGAAQVSVKLSIAGGQLSLVVADNGHGIASRRGRTGSGIENMKTRARLISARFTLSPGTGGKGTRVTVALPLPMSGAIAFAEGVASL